MSKKNFTGGLNSLLGDTPAPQNKPAQDEAKAEIIQPPKHIQDIRATFLIRKDKLEKIKAIAYWERKLFKEVLDEAINSLFESKGPEYLNKALTEFKNLNTK